MTFAIIRGRNGRRHEVDFKDDPITIEVGMSDEVVEIVVEAPEDLAPSHKRRFAMLSMPREELMAALGVELRQKTPQDKAPRPRLVSEDE
jgi:hypothetical protein